MSIAALYDIHGNLPALEAVLAEVRAAAADMMVVGGDVLPGPMPRECLERLLHAGLPTHFIRGNGDREVLAQMEGVETAWYRQAKAEWREPVHWSAQQLGPEHQRLIASWPMSCRLAHPVFGEVLFCHATPRDDNEIFTRATPDARLAPLFEGLGVSLVVCGHTHMQFDLTVGTTRVVNAGSVGMPFGRPGADWLMLADEVQLRHTEYDLAEAAERIRRSSYPQADVFAERSVLHPPSAEEMLSLYSKAELKFAAGDPGAKA